MRSTSPRSCSAHAPSLPAWLALLLLALIPAAAMAQRSTPIQITQPGGAGGDVFAFTVGIDGDTMVVGAYGDNVGASTDQGSASVYRWTGSGWTFEATLIASDGAPGDLFGVSAAISGDTIVVGALGDDVGAFPDQGSAYVFTRSGTTWTQQAKLTAADGSNDDAFGYSVAIRGNTIVAGAYADDIGTNTDQGSAYVFIRTGTVWTQQAKLTAPVPSNTSFGFSVGTDGNSVIVGAYRDDVGANLNQGSAFIFSRSGSLWTQQAKLVASDGAASDSFGFSVAIDGETVIVGAYTDAIGVNTNQGSAYVFTRSGTAWSQQAKLTTPGGATGDLFGSAVALSGNTAIVGAFADDIGATTNQGSASIFTRTGTAWTQQAQLTAPDGAANENFGVSVAVSGDLTLVGAYSDTIGANTIQGSAWVFSRVGSGWIGPDFQTSATAGAPADSFAYSVAISGDTAIVGAWTDDVGANTNQGSAYIFVSSGSAWIQQAQLTATGGAANDVFGSFVAIDGDTAVVGALSDDVGASIDQGSAYVFTRSGTVWTQQAQLLATGGAAGDGLGSSVAIDGDTVIVGAYLDDVGANTNQGSAYVFTRTGTTWTQQAQLISLGGATSDTFGISVALSGNTAIVGAYLDDVGANTNQGSAYVFTRSGTVWTQQAQLNATGGTTEDRFGFSVAIDGDTAIIGAPNDDVGANNAQGAAYVFTRSGSTWTQQAQLTATGGAVNDFFGVSVALSGNTAIVGANADDVGANSDQGSAYIFTRSGSTWTQQALLTPTAGAVSDQFGISVALSGDTAIVGA